MNDTTSSAGFFFHTTTAVQSRVGGVLDVGVRKKTEP